MKNTLLLIGLALSLSAGPALGFHNHGGGMHAQPEERLQRMQEHLELSDSQLEQIRAIHQQDISRREKREQVRAMLSEEQVSKMEAHRDSMRDRHRQRRNAPCPPDAPEAPDAPPVNE